MEQHHSLGAAMAACAILPALMEQLVRSNLLTQDQVHSVFAAARSSLDGWGERSAFKLAHEVLTEMQDEGV
jgi:hypothetical protein